MYLVLSCSSLSSFISRHLALLLQVHLEIGNNTLALQIPNFDARLRGSAEPVPVRAKAQSIHNGASLQRVQHLPLRQIPQQNHTVLPCARAQGAVRRHHHRVHIPGVAAQRRAQLAIGQVPHLHRLIPRSGDNRGLAVVGGEPDAGDPIGVRIAVLDRVLALAEGVPELDRLVARRRHDLAVVGGEGDGEDVLGVADEAAGGLPRLQVPEAELGVPGGGERELAVGGEDDVLDEVRVAGEAAGGDAVVAVLLGEVPED